MIFRKRPARSFVAYHGTTADCVAGIRDSGVQPSRNSDDWLGHGAYYFTKGIGHPEENAKRWAHCRIWDKSSTHPPEENLAVVKMAITIPHSKILDLRRPDSINSFHRARERWLSQRFEEDFTSLPRPSKATYDTELLNELGSTYGIAAIIGNFYICLSPHARYHRLESRIPNVTMLCIAPDVNDYIESSIINVDIFPIQTSQRENENA